MRRGITRRSHLRDPQADDGIAACLVFCEAAAAQLHAVRASLPSGSPAEARLAQLLPQAERAAVQLRAAQQTREQAEGALVSYFAVMEPVRPTTCACCMLRSHTVRERAHGARVSVSLVAK